MNALPFIQRGITPVSSESVGATVPRIRVHFKVEAAAGSRVAVVGNFNDWQPDAHPMQMGRDSQTYERVLYLSPGRYEYKFVINDEWSADPNCPQWTLNEHRTLNSVLEVK